MSEKTAKNIFESLAQYAPGLKNFVPEVGAELRRLGTQGSMEAVSALFSGSAFVPYGPGQYTPSIENHEPQQERELERE